MRRQSHIQELSARQLERSRARPTQDAIRTIKTFQEGWGLLRGGALTYLNIQSPAFKIIMIII